MKGDDKEDIEAKTQALTEVSQKLVERAYAQAGGAEGAAGAAGAEADTAGADAGNDDIVDAEFEEVDDDKK